MQGTDRPEGHSGKAPGVDEIRPEMLKALGVGSWLTCLINIAWKSWGSAKAVADRGGGSPDQKGEPEGVC